MPKIFGQTYTRRQLETRVGNLAQLFSVTEAQYTAGLARGMRFWDVVTAGGLSFRLHPDRCLDIDTLSFKGIPLAWRSSVGPTRPQTDLPSNPEANRQAFHRNFGGGFLMTCGLRHFGPPVQLEGELLPTHGRVHSLPAEQASWRLDWQDEAVFVIEGVVRETRSGAEHLLLTRQFRVPVDGSSFELTDRVENHGFRNEPLAILHHLNVGFPLLSESTLVTVNEQPSTVLESSGTRSCALDGGCVGVFNYSLDLGLEVCFSHPALHLWRQPDAGMNVLGIEPASHAYMQRAEPNIGPLPELAPGETQTYTLSVELFQGGA